MPRALKYLLVVAAVVALLMGMAFTALYLMMKKDQPQMFADPVADHVAPMLSWPASNPTTDKLSILVFSKTQGFRHHESIIAGKAYFQTLAEQRSWFIAETENAAVFNPDQLNRFHVVIFNNATRPYLTATQRAALKEFIEHGGGFIAIHAAGDNSHHEWAWYRDQVIRASFTMHTLFPVLQKATLITEDNQHPTTRHLPKRWQSTDEWYSFSDNPRDNGSKVLLRVDESTYNPWPCPMGDDHPIAWHHQVGQGRIYYNAMGHTAEQFEDERFRIMLVNAIEWVARLPQ